MPYSITKSIDIDFAHHVSGHTGACINIHGHTWKFEVVLSCTQLDPMGFVADFGWLKQNVLLPVHSYLDHAFALNEVVALKMEQELKGVGKVMFGTRKLAAGGESHLGYALPSVQLAEVKSVVWPEGGGIKLALFDFVPTSERLACWLWNVAQNAIAQAKLDMFRDVHCLAARVYETLHPVAAYAEYTVRPE